VTRIDPNVRPVQHVAPDPFTNPFGDLQAAPQELVLQPTQAESSIETLPPPRLSSPVRHAAPSSPRLTAARQPGSGIPADPDRISPLRGTPAPLPESSLSPGERPTGEPCDRIYNDRNCCDLESNCAIFRDRLLAASIRTISLDITPRFNPDLTVEEDLSDRADKLRLLELRQWRNRRGQILATGKMANLDNNSVVIADDAGNEIARLSLNELGEDELCYVTAYWRLPAECALGGLRTVTREWINSTFAWHASALCHKPLYFEEVQLERYGHTAGPLRQPFISGAHFFVNLAALPYKMAINPPHECQYALGYYRPGSCAPWMIQPIPLSLRGAAAEVGVALGFAYLIP
jgi:hypothetical protein